MGDFLFAPYLAQYREILKSMLKTSFALTAKKQLTHDVYELIYNCPDLLKEPPLPGQYVMFQLAPGLNRSYSLASFEWDIFTLIIKRIPDGKWSPMICDALIGAVFQGILPLGHFTLQDTLRSKCFIGTGTGFAPLYAQMLGAGNSQDQNRKMAFIYGVRNFQDSFYEAEIQELGKSFNHFKYAQYFSRELEFPTILSDTAIIRLSGYVTDWINPNNIEMYEEFYVCGSPAMVKSAREKLASLWIEKEQIFWEQF